LVLWKGSWGATRLGRVKRRRWYTKSLCESGRAFLSFRNSGVRG
jgi:hypothetical protein